MGNLTYSPIIIFSKWSSVHLTYRVTSYPQKSDITEKQVDQQIAEAFQLWENHTALTFTCLLYTSPSPRDS